MAGIRYKRAGADQMSRIDERIAAHAVAAEKTWSLSYGRFSKAIARKKLKTGVEIGVAFGGHAEEILKSTKVNRLYGVDPYKHIKGYDDPMNLPQKEFNALYKFVIRRLSAFGSRYTHIRETSEKAVGRVVGNLDFVYIDADHSYQGVWDDLITWYPKINDGGIIGGHDYGHPNFPGVKQAIDEFFRRFNWPINEMGEGVWWVEKKILSSSFIMPAYNAQDTIAASVESIFNGNFSSGDELVVVNDCSTDKTLDVLKKLQKTFPEIKIINHKTNKGGGAARNMAVKIAENHLIFCLDADNLLLPGSVPKLRDFLVESGADVATFNTVRYFRTDPAKPTHEWRYKTSSASLEGALSTFKFPGASGNYLFTKESWVRAGRYPEASGALDTWGFGFRQLATGSKMRVMSDSFYCHRYGHDSYWMRESRTGKTASKALQLLTPFFNLLDEKDVRYIKSSEGRNSWFDNLEKRPIKLKKDNLKKTWRLRLRRLAG